jgi:hypothetical protein
MMSEHIPEGITAEHIIGAIDKISAGIPHKFAKSTGYDVLFEGKRYAPKAVIGVAAGILTGKELGPYDFKGGIGSKCFRTLENNGFAIVTKGDTNPFPEEVSEGFFEGATREVKVNKYERDLGARNECIKYYGPSCQVCGLNFKDKYGAIGEGFIHVHHIVPLSKIGKEYRVNPISHLRPVCPNCHAMLHKRTPPLSVEELKLLLNEES